MRSLKFRAWDTEAEEWIKSSAVIYEHICEFEESKTLQDNMNEKWIVEQYTGLKDKNGKEIYEGDIVAYTLGPGGIQPKFFKDGKKVVDDLTKGACKGQVIFDKATASFKYKMFKDKRAPFAFKKYTAENRLIVIGNIHEDGNLLK